MADVLPSVQLMLHRGQLLQGHAIERNVEILCDNAEDAWARLLTAGECLLVAQPDNLAGVRERYAGWVFD